MYTNHFSLQSLPFENVSDPACFFEQGDYSRVLSRIIDSLMGGKRLDGDSGANRHRENHLESKNHSVCSRENQNNLAG